jgi:hypothetical protein
LLVEVVEVRHLLLVQVVALAALEQAQALLLQVEVPTQLLLAQVVLAVRQVAEIRVLTAVTQYLAPSHLRVGVVVEAVVAAQQGLLVVLVVAETMLQAQAVQEIHHQLHQVKVITEGQGQLNLVCMVVAVEEVQAGLGKMAHQITEATAALEEFHQLVAQVIIMRVAVVALHFLSHNLLILELLD